MTCILGKIKDGVYCRDDKGGCVLKIQDEVYFRENNGWCVL